METRSRVNSPSFGEQGAGSGSADAPDGPAPGSLLPAPGVLLPNPARFPTLALPYGPDRAGGADHPRERCRRTGARHSPGRSTPGSLWDAPPGRPLDLPLGGTGDGGGRGRGPAEDGRVEVGGAVRRREGTASIPGAGTAGAAGRPGTRAVPVLGHARGGRMIRKREPRWQSAAERARVAAELIEEAESPTGTSTIASPADVARAGLPPPVTAQLPSPPPPAAPGDVPAPAGPKPEPTLDDAIAADPDNVSLLVERAGLLAGAAHYRAAQQDYERALCVDPIHGQALTGLGVLLSRRGLWSEAVPHLRRASEVDPGRAAAWFYLGEALNHVDELDGAQAAYERAVELEPRNARALYGLGIGLDRLHRPVGGPRTLRRSRCRRSASWPGTSRSRTPPPS